MRKGWRLLGVLSVALGLVMAGIGVSGLVFPPPPPSCESLLRKASESLSSVETCGQLMVCRISLQEVRQIRAEVHAAEACKAE